MKPITCPGRFRSLFRPRLALLLGVLGLSAEYLGAQDLVHRWSFNDATDSVGGASVSLNGTASIAGGKLVLAGGGTRANHAVVSIGPTIAASSSLTVETWFTISTAAQTWRKLWMFGVAGGSAAQSGYIDFTPFSGSAGNPPSSSFKTVGGAEITTRADPNPPIQATGTQILSTVVYDDPGNQIRIYLNGVLADSEIWTGTISQLGSTTQNFIGAAVFFGDLDWAGTVDEMRIWQGAMGDAQALANFNAGPDAIAPHDPKLQVAGSVSEESNGAPITFQIPISNAGSSVPLSINTATFVNGDEFYFEVTTGLPLVIPAGESRDLSVDFDPQFGIGGFVSDLMLESNDPFGPQRIIPVTVEVAEPNLSVPGSPLYGPLASTAPPQTYTLEISNTGLGELEIYNGFFTAGTTAPTHFQRYATVHDFFVDGSLLVPAGGSIDLEFTFDPTGLANGLKTGLLYLETNELDQFEVLVNIGVEVTAPAQSGTPELAHRWSFNDATDSVGSAGVTLNGTAAITGGKLQLGGGGVRTNHAEVPIGDTIAGVSSLTVEAWFTAAGAGQTWSKVWMFGTPGDTPGQSTYADFTPLSGIANNPPSSSFSTPLGGADTRADPNPPELAAAIQHHAVTVFDAAADLISLYIDGVFVDSGPWTGEVHQLGITTQNFIGAAVFFGDQDWAGTVDEMRIWKGVLNATDVAASYAAGTETVPVPGAEPLRITGFQLAGGNMVITGTSGLVGGQTYHLQAGTLLTDFAPVPGSTFTGGNPVPTVPASGARRFVRIADGPVP